MDMLMSIVYKFMGLIRSLLEMLSLNTDRFDEIMDQFKPEEAPEGEVIA